MFGNNSDVAFADVNLQEAPIRGPPHNPGSGGWPTIRYFTKETGIDGGTYTKITDKPICQELGDRHNMIDYVEGYGSTSLCNVETKANCNEKELAFTEKYSVAEAEKQTSELQRLEGMGSKPMSATSEEWILRRTRILKQLAGNKSSSSSSDGGEEL